MYQFPAHIDYIVTSILSHSFSIPLLPPPLLPEIELLVPPSQASFISITTDSVTLVIQLPTLGTPLILIVSFTFTSTSHTHTHTHNISGSYGIGDHVRVTVGGDSDVVDLKGGNRYMVTARARNFVCWSGISNATGFTTSKRIYC